MDSLHLRSTTLDTLDIDIHTSLHAGLAVTLIIWDERTNLIVDDLPDVMIVAPR
jgi:hypothetical protein